MDASGYEGATMADNGGFTRRKVTLVSTLHL